MSNYTSNLLCHFVGRSKENDDERFELLITIIRSCRLIANVNAPNNLETSFFTGYECDRLGEVFGRCDCVCFCDIPNDALAIHTKKYSRFGLGFRKTFIAQKGAHPVMYVPINYPIIEIGDSNIRENITVSPKEPNKYFPYILSKSMSTIISLEINLFLGNHLFNSENSDTNMMLSLLDRDVVSALSTNSFHPIVFSILKGISSQFAYVKLYDVSLPDDHPDNYYMEREWRCLKNVNFSLSDIHTIYLPNRSYQERFRQEFPEYTGKFYIFEDAIKGNQGKEGEII